MPTPQRKQAVDGPIIRRAATVNSAAVDAATGLITVSFSSDQALVARSSWFDDDWLERLGHNPDEIDLTFLNSGTAPALWGHDTYERESMVGVATRAWVEGGKGYAEIRLSSRDDVKGLAQDITDGIVSNVSVGYKILERTLVTQTADGPNEYRVTKWKPMEISFVPIPADENVGVGRSADAPAKFTITDIEETAMSDGNTQAPVTAPTDQRAAAPADSGTNPPLNSTEAARIASDVTKAERERIAVIGSLARSHDLGDEFVTTHTNSGANAEAVRAAALEILATRSAANPQRPGLITAGTDQVEKTRTAAENWLLHRSGQKIDAALLNGNDFRGCTLLDIARRSLEMRGFSTKGMLGIELARAAYTHSTSDFPIVLQNVLNKTLQTAYTAVPDTWKSFCATSSLADFRPHYRYRMGGFSNLATVAEGAEYTYGTISDAERNSIVAATKGKLMSMTRQMIVNDDLGAFTNMATIMGRAAARTIEVDVYALLNSNPTMPDGNALFSAAHANLLASGGTAPTVAALEAARVSMASQTDVGANDYIDIRPAVWLGPISLGGTMRVINEAQYDVDVTNKFQIPNKSRGLVSAIVDTPRLSGTAWYLFANPSDEPVLEVGFLNGQQSPYTEMQQGFEIDGMAWKVRLDYGVAAVGYRGAYKNPGA